MATETYTCGECPLCHDCLLSYVCGYMRQDVRLDAECILPPPVCGDYNDVENRCCFLHLQDEFGFFCCAVTGDEWCRCLREPAPIGKPCPCNPKRVRRVVGQIGGGDAK
jgi:hypothetical protein